MPDYLDHLFIFGRQTDQRDVGFGSFREQMSLRGSSTSHRIAPLGRSGRQYQLCYNLKGVSSPKNANYSLEGKQFSIRHAAVYHRFDVVGGNTVWIVTKGHTDVHERIKELTRRDARPEDRSFNTPEECFRSSLSAHLLFCHWATEDWREYIRWLEEVIQQEVRCSNLSAKYFQSFHFIPSSFSKAMGSNYIVAD